MTLRVDLLEHSFSSVLAQGEAFAATFYQQLFELAPETQALFADTSMEEQEQKLLAALALVMAHLREPERLAPVLKHLGEQHLKYRVTPDGFEMGGEALVETLRLFMGDHWSSELEVAWEQAYDAVVTLMLSDA